MTPDRPRLWAPFARSVSIVVGETEHEMTAMDGGWFEASIELAAGSDYLFRVDGSDPLADPRSRHQPLGVGGPSRTVDHGSFPWTDDGWAGVGLEGLTIYEMHVGTFTPEGTFAAAASKLDHLAELGVGAVELMPFAQFPGRWGWGYDAVLIYSPYDRYGAPDDLKRFVDACHERQIAVIADIVDNHLGPVNNDLDRFGPYFSRFHETPWGAGFNLDEHSAGPVRSYLIGSALQWLEDYRMDGLRLDAVQAIHDSSAFHILEELSLRVDELSARTGRRKLLIAETDEVNPLLTAPRDAGGRGLDAQWSEDLHRVLHQALTGESHGYYADVGGLGDLEPVLVDGVSWSGRLSASRGRRFGRPWGTQDRSRMVAYLQSHDTVGNRPGGDRLTHLTSYDLAKVAAVVLMTAPHTPMIFQGEEWGASTPFLYFVDLPDERVLQAVRRGRRDAYRAMGLDPRGAPDPDDGSSFTSSKLNWEETAGEPHSSMLRLYQRLLRLRREMPSLNDGGGVKFEWWGAGSFGYVRGDVMTAVNLSELEVTKEQSGWSLVLASDPRCAHSGGTLKLPAASAAVLRRSG